MQANMKSIQVCDSVPVRRSVIYIHSFGLSDAAASCSCKIDFQTKTNKVYYFYYTDQDRYENCGINVLFGNNEFSCKTQRNALKSFKTVRFYKTVNATAQMCLEIRTDRQVLATVTCGRITESDEEETDDSKEEDHSKDKSSKERKRKGNDVGTPTRSAKLPDKNKSFATPKTLTFKYEKKNDTGTPNTPTFSDGKNETGKTLATINFPDDTNKAIATPATTYVSDKKTKYAGTPTSPISPDGENKTLGTADSLAESNKDMDTVVIVGVITSLAVLAVVVTSIVCIRHNKRMKDKQSKDTNREALNKETEPPHVYSEIDEVGTLVTNRAPRADAYDLVVTYNAMYNLESSPDKLEEVPMNYHTYHILTPNTASDEDQTQEPDQDQRPDTVTNTDTVTDTVDSQHLIQDEENYTEIGSIDDVNDINTSKSEENASCLSIYQEINEAETACQNKTN